MLRIKYFRLLQMLRLDFGQVFPALKPPTGQCTEEISKVVPAYCGNDQKRDDIPDANHSLIGKESQCKQKAVTGQKEHEEYASFRYDDQEAHKIEQCAREGLIVDIHRSVV